MYAENQNIHDEFFVQYHITHRCNLICNHCYQKNYQKEGELTTPDIYRSIKEISEMVLDRSEEHTSELQSHSFISYAVFCLKKKK